MRQGDSEDAEDRVPAHEAESRHKVNKTILASNPRKPSHFQRQFSAPENTKGFSLKNILKIPLMQKEDWRRNAE